MWHSAEIADTTVSFRLAIHRAKRHRYGLLALLLLVLALAAYCYHLTSYLINDDESGYLYQTWLISQGEVPYRDFLTPQQPVFLYLGALSMCLFGPSVAAARTLSVVATVLSGLMLYLAAKQLYGPGAGLWSILLLLSHPLVYEVGWFYRSCPLMLLGGTTGLAMVSYWWRKRSWPWLSLAGVAFAVATLCKLLSALLMVGCVLFGLSRAWRERGHRFQWAIHGLAFVLPYILVIAMVTLTFSRITPNFLPDVFGHHLRQGSGLGWSARIVKALQFFRDFLGHYYPLLPLVALAWVVMDRRNPSTAFLAWQFAPLLVFFTASRELHTRYILWLLPTMALACSQAVMTLWQRHRLRVLAVLLVIVILAPALWENRRQALFPRQNTMQVANYIQLHTDPDDWVLTDFPGLCFYARRHSTPLGAGVSDGAASTGQITGRLLMEEIDRYPVKLVVLDISKCCSHHLINMKDYDWFLAQIEDRFEWIHEMPWGRYLLAFYRRKPTVSPQEIPHRTELHLGDRVTLLGYDLPAEEVEAGEGVRLTLYWRAEAPIAEDYTVFVHLLDESGMLRSQADSMPWHNAFPTSRWEPGVIIPDEYRLVVPESAWPGEYRVTVGLYLWQTGERLPIRTSGGDLLPESRFFLEPPITVGALSAE